MMLSADFRFCQFRRSEIGRWEIPLWRNEMVRKGGLEPPRFYPPDPKCCVLLVRATGVEPASPCGHKVLSLARLPVPPPPHCFGLVLGTICPNPNFEFSKLLRCFRYVCRACLVVLIEDHARQVPGYLHCCCRVYPALPQPAHCAAAQIMEKQS